MLRVSVNSGPMVVYVTVSQMLSTQIFFNALHHYDMKFHLMISFYSVWNLDFLHGVYKLCLHPDMSILQTISLDYAVAVYPLMLISITYCLV